MAATVEGAYHGNIVAGEGWGQWRSGLGVEPQELWGEGSSETVAGNLCALSSQICQSGKHGFSS